MEQINDVIKKQIVSKEKRRFYNRNNSKRYHTQNKKILEEKEWHKRQQLREQLHSEGLIKLITF